MAAFQGWGSWEFILIIGALGKRCGVCVYVCFRGGLRGVSLSPCTVRSAARTADMKAKVGRQQATDATTMIATIEADPNKARARGRFALGALLLACAGLLATAAAALSFRESALGEASDHLESEAQECSPARPTVAQTLQIKRRNTAPCPARSMRPPPRWVCAGAPPPACDGGASN